MPLLIPVETADPSPGSLLPLFLPPAHVRVPHLTPNSLIKGEDLGAMNDHLLLLLILLPFFLPALLS